MNQMPGIFAASALVLGLLSAGPSQAADKVRDAVEKGIRQFVAAANAHDAAGIARLYATDAAVFPPGAARVDGRPAIQKFWQGMLAAGVSKLSVRTIEVQSSGNLAYDVGQFALDAPGKDGQPVHSAGKYVVVWKRTKGVWQLYRDIWNETP
jgi:uncharacterized protein (TIGR02246 family)